MQKKHLAKQLKILLNYVLGPLLFIVLVYIIYKKVETQPDLPQKLEVLKNSFASKNIWKIVGLFLLLCLNWSIEARKWQLLMRPVEKVNFITAIKAILSGLALSLFLPNGFGEYPARALYMKEGNRLRSVALNVAGSMAQLIVTLVVGITSLIYLKTFAWAKSEPLEGLSVLWLNGIISMIILGTLILLITYFRLSWLTRLAEKIPFILRYKYLIENVEAFHWKELTRILGLSFIRFIVFAVQYMVVLHLFEVKIDAVNAFCTTSVLFLFLAILPTIPFADVGIRGQAGTQLFGLITPDAFGVIATIAVIWFINLILPSAAGSLFLLGIKLFKKSDKQNIKKS
ncbi:lysylphosphatidylglycerol synthase transmembrane domain-containing protein [Parafilimonas sp.]|uniref:lysylphosphatidylglycerol synthase transmembrane domain-containing protein n=1 Tax=Parafilimonas sp. TaxID=1969739 RepID=UPI003F80F662